MVALYAANTANFVYNVLDIEQNLSVVRKVTHDANYSIHVTEVCLRTDQTLFFLVKYFKSSSYT